MKIKNVELQTADLALLREFYSSVLELSVETSHSNKLVIRVGDSDLLFTPADGVRPFYHYAVNIPANKIDEARSWLVRKVDLLWMVDYESDVSDFMHWHAKSVYFYDPAGNIVELIARFDLPNAVEAPFSSEHFLSISEVGLVFKKEQFDQKIDAILSTYSLSYFPKQPPLPHFRAIGDDQGLFVAVPEHRNWYPTNKACEIFPLKMEFEVRGKACSLAL